MKKLVVNCASCNLCNLKEETLKAYESVRINAAVVAVTAQTNELIHRYPVTINAGSVLELPQGETVSFQTQNGTFAIDGNTRVEGAALLVVNGRLHIAPEGLKAAQSYYAIQVNGQVTIPQSLSGQLTNLQVNGATNVYPDGAVLLKSTAVIDRFFPLRARSSLYYAAGRLVFVDTALDADALVEKGVRFESPKAILAQSLCEKILPILNEDVDITVVPDGTAFIQGDTTLDDSVIRRYGVRLYVQGDLTVQEAGENALRQLAQLYVSGKVRLTAPLQEAFDQIDAQYRQKEIIRSYAYTVCDKISAVIDRQLLENCEQGLLVADCASVRLAQDIPADWILQRLTVRDCAQVFCSPEQESAVAAVSTDVANIGAGDLMEQLTGAASDTKVINAAACVL